MPARSITSIYVVGNSYSAATQATGMKTWVGKLSASLMFGYVQPNNQAVPGCQLLDYINPNGVHKPGLLTQIGRLPVAPSKTKALFVLWLLPNLAAPIDPSQPLYTSGMDRVYGMGFRMVLMPNCPDLSKVPLYKNTYTRIQLQAVHDSLAGFNQQYFTMMGAWRQRYPTVKFATCDVFSLWDGTGTVPDGLHPTEATHALFASWFKTSVAAF